MKEKQTNQIERDTGQDKTQLSGDASPKDFRSSPNTPSSKRMSVSLSADAARMLESIAAAQGITQNEALRKAIATEAYISKEVMEGSKVLLQKVGGEIREVVFR